MEWFNSYEQFFKQVSDWQRSTYDNWVSMIPNTQKYSTFNYRENFNKTLTLQETLTSNYLELQAQLARMSVDTQKQFVENYFKLLRSW